MESTISDDLAIVVYGSEQYADFSIKCGIYEFKLHEEVVCPKSEYFARALAAGKFKESETRVVQMHDELPDAISAMVEFFYKGSYDLPRLKTLAKTAASGQTESFELMSDELKSLHFSKSKEDAESQSTGDSEVLASAQNTSETFHTKGLADQPAAMLFHLEVFKLADAIGCEELAALACSNFVPIASMNWRSKEFCAAIRKAYEINEDRTTRIAPCTALLQVVTEHLHQLCNNTNEDNPFDHVLRNEPDFTQDIAKAYAGVYDGLPAISIGQKIFFCTGCTFSGEVNKTFVFPRNRCPKCSQHDTIRKVSGLTNHSVQLTCKNPVCKFVFNTRVWEKVNEFRCPCCGWKAPRREWEEAKR